MRRWIFLFLAVSICTSVWAQAPGLSPKAGALSSNLYTNLYFGFNYQVPKDWTVAFVASEGPCSPECLILDVRPPSYPKPPRMVNIGAEAVANAGPDHVPSLAAMFEQTGKKRTAPARPVEIAGHKFYRIDYRVPLDGGDVYHAFLSMPTKDYVVVFTIEAESRKMVDTMVDDLLKTVTFAGGQTRESTGTSGGQL